MTPYKWVGPAILLVDLDAFFASVEQLDHPSWRGKPVIVGGDADKHGVVATCSYEARKYGVRSAMAAAQAKKLCPDAIWSPGHFDRYRQMSRQVMQLLSDETPYVQQVSIDEAFLDVSPTPHNTESPVNIAIRIRKNVASLGITCSVGVATTKSIAKIASEMGKPDGLTVVYPGDEKKFLYPLPIRKMSGIGSATETYLKRHGIKTLGDLANADSMILKEAFGKNAEVFRKRAMGTEVETVETDSDIKSVSHEMTFARDLTDFDDMTAALAALAAQVGRRLRKKGLKGSTITLKLRYADRTIHTIQRQLPKPSDDDLSWLPVLSDMLSELLSPNVPVRLLGVGISGFDEDYHVQESLFDLDDSRTIHERPDAFASEEKRQSLLNATDALKERFGENAINFGRELKNRDNTTGTASKNPADYK
ncbi:MAG: DNA polymerase IV [Eggerthellaceae bacterium]|nr:DNA polymerase IV [Eggerthellaceae bacterium]